jgi:hypothetical protein
VTNPLSRHPLTMFSLGFASAGTLAIGLALSAPGSAPMPSNPPAPAAPTPAPTPTPAAPATKPSAPGAPGSAPDAIIRDLETAAGNRGKSGAAGAAPTTGSSPSGASRLLREGSFVASRTGRVTRAASGDWLFTFDGDAKGAGEPPMVLMPCLNLMAMERTLERSGESTNFTVSGQVYVYKGRNHLLPTMFTVNRLSQLNPGG